MTSIGSLEPQRSQADLTGGLAALDDLDTDPANLSNRLHRLDRELKDWWSLSPPSPAHPALRVLVKPERIGDRGIWRIGPITWQYAR